MPNQKPTKLSDVIREYAPQGSNDRLWFTIEHQLTQAKISLQCAQDVLSGVIDSPENENEREVAQGAQELLNKGYVEFLAAHSAYLHFMAGTDVNERVGNVGA